MTPQTSERLSPRALAGIFALALGLRLFHVLAMWYEHPELVDHPVLDAAHYHAWAIDILADRGLARQLFWMHPVYPYTLAALYAVTGPSPLAAALAQGVLGAISACLLASVVARRLASPGTGLAAGVLLGVYGPLVIGDTLLETTAVSIVFLLASIWLLDATRRRWAACLLAGVAFAAACLCRGNLLVCAPAVLASVILARHLDRRVRAGLVACFLAGMVVVHLAVGARNYRVAGVFSMSTSNLGPALYLGHHPAARTGGHEPPAFIRPDPAHELEDWRDEAARRLGRQPTQPEMDRFWRRQTLEVIRADPAREVVLFGRKIALAFGAFELGDNYSLAYMEGLSPVRFLFLPGFATMLGLGCVGAWARWRDRARFATFYGVVVLYALTLGLLFVSARFRAPLAPFVIAFAGAGCVAMLEAWRVRDLRRIGALAVVALAGTGLSYLATSGASRTHDRAQALHSHALVMLETGRPREAHAMLAESASCDPTQVTTWINLAIVRARLGDRRGSLRAAREATGRSPGNAEAHALAGVGLSELGDAAGAEVELRRAVELAPEDVTARYNLAMLLGQAGRPREAKAELEAVLARAPGHEGAQLGRALSLLDVEPAAGRAMLSQIAEGARDPQIRATAAQILAGRPPP